MKQRTIQKPVEVIGIGLHKGKPVKLKLEPLVENSGIVFYRSDKAISIPLNSNNIVDTKLATVIGKNNVTISTIEHLMSTIYAFGIDNLRIIVDNDEIPILDGSASGFTMLIKEAGIKELEANKKFLKLKKEIVIKEGEKYVKLIPTQNINFIIDYTIEFNHPLIRKQRKIFDFSIKNYLREIANARTFGFLKEIQYLRSIGLALGGSLENAIVLDDKGILNDNLRYPDEFVRHKILDAIGDLSVIGYNLLNAKYISYKGSHHLNAMLTKKILENENNYEIIEIQRNEKAMNKIFAYN